jgi:hypothetical protein
MIFKGGYMMNKICTIVFILVALLLSTALAFSATLPENTTTAINSGITFTSDTYEIGSFSTVVVMTEASHDSAAGGVMIDQSFDVDCVTATSPTFQYTSSFTYTATAGKVYAAAAVGKCFRVRYTNGGTNQTPFDLTTNLWGGKQ